MINLAALQTALETDPRYAAAWAAGDNATLVSLLNQRHPTNTAFQSVSRETLLTAIGEGIRALTGDALARLRVIAAGESVDLSQASRRQELTQIFTGQTDVLTRLSAAATRPATYADAFGAQRVSIEDVRAVARLSSTSYRARYLRGEV